MDNLESLNKYLASSGKLKDPLVVTAFQHVDRAKFVKPELMARAYEDITLPIGSGQTISKPSEVAFMIELLEPKRGEKILDIGSGSGWTTALLADITGFSGHVYAIEIMPQLLDMSRHNLNKFQYRNITVVPAGTELGLREFAPYDKILVSAFVNHIPGELTDQLANTGIMVMALNERIIKLNKDAQGNISTTEFSTHNLEPLIDNPR